jgi:protein transport protein SEC23
MDVIELENQTGIRFSWNVWPQTREESNKLEIPLSCLYTPFKVT